MKLNLIRIVIANLLSAAVVLLSSCQTTGDPSTGGIFWSEGKAQDRLAERQYRLEKAESGTRSANRRSAETQRKIDSLR